MKQKFSKHWKASKQPRKQRKYRANAPLHVRHKMVSANLNKDLRKKYGKRSFPLRKEDDVKIMRGEFKNKTGKIASVDLKRLRVSIEAIQKTKKDGTKVNVWFNPSNLQIKELNLDDKKRKEALERKATTKSISDETLSSEDEKKSENKDTKINNKENKK